MKRKAHTRGCILSIGRCIHPERSSAANHHTHSDWVGSAPIAKVQKGGAMPWAPGLKTRI